MESQVAAASEAPIAEPNPALPPLITVLYETKLVSAIAKGDIICSAKGEPLYVATTHAVIGGTWHATLYYPGCLPKGQIGVGVRWLGGGTGHVSWATDCNVKVQVKP